MRVEITLKHVEISIMSAIFTRKRVKFTLVCACRLLTLHVVSGYLTLRVKTNLVRIEMTLVRVEITLCVYKSHSNVS
jgi:hypothetical protein